jgi:signal peptidase II
LTPATAVPEPSGQDSVLPRRGGPTDYPREGAESTENAAGVAGSEGAIAHRARPLALAVLGGAATFAVCADLVTKQLALTHLSSDRPARLLGGALYLTLTRNSGAAFSLAPRYTVIFPIITVVVVAGIAWLARRLRSVPWALAMGLILGGALGNLVDRVFRAPGPFRGHVIDFLSVFDEAGRVWPIFNVADSALVCGVVLAIGLEVTGRGRDGRRVRGSNRDAH